MGQGICYIYLSVFVLYMIDVLCMPMSFVVCVLADLGVCFNGYSLYLDC